MSITIKFPKPKNTLEKITQSKVKESVEWFEVIHEEVMARGFSEEDALNVVFECLAAANGSAFSCYDPEARQMVEHNFKMRMETYTQGFKACREEIEDDYYENSN